MSSPLAHCSCNRNANSWSDSSWFDEEEDDDDEDDGGSDDDELDNEGVCWITWPSGKESWWSFCSLLFFLPSRSKDDEDEDEDEEEDEEKREAKREVEEVSDEEEGVVYRKGMMER